MLIDMKGQIVLQQFQALTQRFRPRERSNTEGMNFSRNTTLTYWERTFLAAGGHQSILPQVHLQNSLLTLLFVHSKR